jgi:hypothetical protein
MAETAQSGTKPRLGGALGLALLVGFLALCWTLSIVVLWLAYDIRTQILGGYYRQEQALALVAKMALIITILNSAVWILVEWRGPKRSGWRLGWNVVWKTWTILVIYVAVVLIRRQLWSPGEGMNDDAMFLPVIGYTNAQFLSESGWLSFLIQVIPITGLISGGLYLLRARVLQRCSSALSV